MRLFPLVAACAIAACIASRAQAADNGVYAGVSIGQTKTDISSDVDAFFDDKDTGIKLFVGLRPIDWAGVELGYVNLGQVSQNQDTASLSGVRVEQTGFHVSGMVFWDIATFDLFAKAGLIRWDGETRFNSFFGTSRFNEQGTDLTWGVGAQARLGSLAARLEFERYEIDTNGGLTDKPQMISLGVSWTFF